MILKGRLTARLTARLTIARFLRRHISYNQWNQLPFSSHVACPVKSICGPRDNNVCCWCVVAKSMIPTAVNEYKFVSMANPSLAPDVVNVSCILLWAYCKFSLSAPSHRGTAITWPAGKHCPWFAWYRVYTLDFARAARVARVVARVVARATIARLVVLRGFGVGRGWLRVCIGF